MTNPPDNSPTFSPRFTRLADHWRLRTREVAFDRMPKLMGIVNVTPDSFSDGGSFFDSAKAIDQALRLAGEGADLLDIGGESTRPYSAPVDAREELRRVLPVIEAVARQTSVPISMDTSKSEVAAAAIAAGAEIINDVTGLAGDPRMIDVALASGAGVCAMHMQGNPQTMQDNPTYGDVVAEIHKYLKQRRDALLAAGIPLEKICLDPGIGFGKTHQHNLDLMANCHRFHDLDCPLLVGHSRKGFIGKVLGDKEQPRDFGTLGAAFTLAQAGVQVIRVHEVRPLREAFLLFEATGGFDGVAGQIV